MFQKKFLCSSLIVSILITQGCGQHNTMQTIHAAGTDILVSITPTPIVTMQPEQVDIEFSNNSKASVQNVIAELSMPDMAMGDKIQLTQAASGKYQGSYRFSMAGKWTEKIEYKIDGKTEIATTTWDIKE